MDFFGNRKEKQRNKKIQREICPDCSGWGFFSSVFETVHVHDCHTCFGTGKSK